MQEKIIDLLKRKQDYISGDQISQKLGISRQALWKHIQQLKDTGYDIVAVPHLGYKLVSCPDRLFTFEVSHGLNTKFIAKRIYYFDNLASTMDNALQLGLNSAPEGTLVLAEGQARGRGRLGRDWFSPRYKGIYLSLILRPKIPVELNPLLTLMAAVSVCEAIKEILGLSVQIKWPNDIFMQNKKLGGILTELNAEMDITRFVVIGIGLNVNNEKKALPALATSLKEQNAHQQIDRVSLLKEILRQIELNYLLLQNQSSHSIIDKWRRYNITLGRRVRIVFQNKQLEGEAFDIDTDGGLLVRTDSGLIQKITGGDLVHCR
ncbi:biotin--[acetyl-CoA-carboxylase] ligase [bacterium]|nr:MAG: biotin--[acetyl-CoA-carboxylase] ligase [bacterium]